MVPTSGLFISIKVRRYGDAVDDLWRNQGGAGLLQPGHHVSVMLEASVQVSDDAIIAAGTIFPVPQRR